MSLFGQGLQRSLKEMLDPKFPVDKTRKMKVYKTLQDTEKILEEEVGVSVCWVSFSLKNHEMSAEGEDEFQVTTIRNVNFTGDSPSMVYTNCD